MIALQTYEEQRQNARRRGIPWGFTFETWREWWIEAAGPSWFAKRGRTKGKLCMARVGDKGAYKPGNVKCITHQANLTDAAANDTIAFGEQQGHAVLDDAAARDIFTSTETVEELAIRYGIAAGTINDIRSGRTWCRVTRGLTRINLRGRNQHDASRTN